MGFKLIKIESSDPNKIVLPMGTLVFGRGKVLNVDDKRVSRKHGQLNVSEKLFLKSLHTNPCFYLKKGTDEVKVLKCNNEIELCMGDRFGLLPESHWFEVIFCDENEHSTTKHSDSKVEECTASETQLQTESDFETDTVESPKHNQIASPPSSPSLLDNERTVKTSPPANFSESVQEDISTNNVDIDENNAQSPHKRKTSDDGDIDKRIKLEPPDVKQEKDDTQPGSSTDGDGKNNGNDMPPSPQKPTVIRERCYYGAQCYRRNPQHLSQFSHPRDPDWGPGPVGPCPYGASCSKPDPRHWSTHSHPPGAAPPAHPAPRVPQRGKVKTKKCNRRSSEDSLSQTLIVDGKRKRKTVQLDVWSGSEPDSEPDPFGSDDSDEWQPSCDMSQDYTQD